MNAALITLGCLVLLGLGYRIYSRFLARKVYHTEGEQARDEPMPCDECFDGIDYVPAKRGVLFGHHFSSIAGAAPILGPAIAIVWGWVPALLWVVLGSIFMGAVHDYGALVLSARYKGRSIGLVTEKIIGKRSRLLFLTIIFLLVFIVIAVFAWVIATLFVNYPGTVIPINFEIIVAIFIGWWAYKRKKGLLVPSIVALILLYVMTYIGFQYPVRLPEWLWINGSEVMTWIVFLMGYGFVASVLPVWTLLQPRDYINSHQLVVGLICIYLGIFIAQPAMDAPAVRFEGNPLPWFPFLFITIACGAISGFHALVSSGTTSKQLMSMRDARPIGYGSMIGEATLAVAATIAVGAGFADADAWHHHYSNVAEAGKLSNKLGAFVDGTAGFLAEIGLTQTMTDGAGNISSLGAVFISVLVISFAATSLDTAVRIQRYVIGEIGESLHIKPLATNRYLQAGLGVGLSFLLVITDSTGKGGLMLWPLFGSTNQLLGSLTLLVISVWLYRSNFRYWYTLAPMIFITGITFIATYYNFMGYLYPGDGKEANYLLASISFVIAACQLWIIFEGIKIFGKGRNSLAKT